jgi:hypothetical protein
MVKIKADKMNKQKNKKMKKILIILILLIGFSFTGLELMSQNPPEPPGEGHGNNNNLPGGGAPLGSGLAILLVLGSAYGGYKIYRAKRTNLDIPLNERFEIED